MAVGKPPQGEIPPVPGFTLATTETGTRYKDRDDLFLVKMSPPAATAGVFTTNLVCAPSVTLCRKRLPGGYAEGLAANAGIANASMGDLGWEDAEFITQNAAQALNADPETIFTASTGSIGERLDAEGIAACFPQLADNLQPGNWWAAAKAFMTTDTFPKAGSRTIDLGGKSITIAGIAKGSGMIHPNMATMLSYLFMDAAITPQALQVLLERAVAVSFNSITVDGDTSTNDTLMAFASGVAGNHEITDPDSLDAAPLAEAITSLCQELAQWIVRDGEGASKFVTIRVTGAPSAEKAKRVGMSVAQSSLVKTACAGSDPNWGRIIAAIGYAGVDFDVEKMKVWLGDALIVIGTKRAPDYTEEQGQAVMNQEKIDITIDMGSGEAEQTVWTCDLTHGYITINADYRT